MLEMSQPRKTPKENDRNRALDLLDQLVNGECAAVYMKRDHKGGVFIQQYHTLRTAEKALLKLQEE